MHSFQVGHLEQSPSTSALAFNFQKDSFGVA